MGGWMDGCKSHFKDCLQHLKKCGFCGKVEKQNKKKFKLENLIL